MADETFDQLRGRFMRFRANRPLAVIHAALDVHPNTMLRFLAGSDVSPIVMRKIQRWCNAEEQKKDDPYGRP
jgi:predicted alpha/beta hydrolase